MRTALLAAHKRTLNGELRAELVLGGRSVLGRQVDLARSLGCERFICLSEAHSGEVLALQREVESVDLTFHAVRSNLQLAGLVHADDELVMLCDGLVPDTAVIASMLRLSGFEHGLDLSGDTRLPKVIVTLPAEHSLSEQNPEDFERIDRDRHWAGFGIVRALHLHKLADLPPDGEAMSLVLRLALQARTKCSELDTTEVSDGRWLLANDAARLEKHQAALIHGLRKSLAGGSVGSAIAAQFVVGIAPRWLRNGSEVVAGVSVLVALAVVGLSLWGLAWQQSATSPLSLWLLAMAGVSAFAGEISFSWSKLRTALWSRGRKALDAAALRFIVDLSCALSLVFAHGIAPNPAAQIALPLVAIGLARIAGAKVNGRLSGFWRDRTIHMVGFAVATGFGLLGEALALFTLGALVQLMLRERAE